MENNYLLEVREVSKRFGGVKALEKVSLEVNHNEILAVVGDNGAGKSTLMKVVSGAILPDDGQIFFEGKEVVLKNPKDAAELGIQMLYQDLALVDSLDVTGNIFLGREICKRLLGFIDILLFNKMRRDGKDHLRALGIDLKNIRQKAKNLSGGQRQVTAISKAMYLYGGTKLVILDEPTAALGIKQTKKVNELIKSLKEKNMSVIVITHNLHHVFLIADRVIVLRQGRRVGEKVIKDTDGDEVVKMINGDEFARNEL